MFIFGFVLKPALTSQYPEVFDSPLPPSLWNWSSGFSRNCFFEFQHLPIQNFPRKKTHWTVLASEGIWDPVFIRMISKSALLIVGLGQKSSSSSGCIVGSSAPLGPTTSTASGGSTSCISASCGGSTGSARGMAFCFFKALAKQVFKKTCPFWSLFGFEKTCPFWSLFGFEKTCPFWSLFGFEKTCPFWSLFGFEKTGSSYFSGITPRMFPRWNVGANLWIEFVCNRKFKYVRTSKMEVLYKDLLWNGWRHTTALCKCTGWGGSEIPRTTQVF